MILTALLGGDPKNVSPLQRRICVPPRYGVFGSQAECCICHGHGKLMFSETGPPPAREASPCLDVDATPTDPSAV
jgi:hypothetical protein